MFYSTSAMKKRYPIDNTWGHMDGCKREMEVTSFPQIMCFLQ